MAEGIRIFNALTGIEQARLTGQDGAFRCRRHDECSLAFCRSGTPFLEPLPLPLRDAPAALGAGVDPGLPQPIAVPNGELAKVRVGVHKSGAEPVYWIRLVPQRSPQDGFVLWPSQALPKLDAGATEMLEGQVAFASPDDPDRGYPSAAAALLDVAVQVDQGEPIPLRVRVHGQVPELAVAARPTKSLAVRTLTLRLRNNGA
jgi:hypothetical protein